MLFFIHAYCVFYDSIIDPLYYTVWKSFDFIEALILTSKYIRRLLMIDRFMKAIGLLCCVLGCELIIIITERQSSINTKLLIITNSCNTQYYPRDLATSSWFYKYLHKVPLLSLARHRTLLIVKKPFGNTITRKMKTFYINGGGLAITRHR